MLGAWVALAVVVATTWSTCRAGGAGREGGVGRGLAEGGGRGRRRPVGGVAQLSGSQPVAGGRRLAGGDGEGAVGARGGDDAVGGGDVDGHGVAWGGVGQGSGVERHEAALGPDADELAGAPFVRGLEQGAGEAHGGLVGAARLGAGAGCRGDGEGSGEQGGEEGACAHAVGSGWQAAARGRSRVARVVRRRPGRVS
ncbi:hypothetical protein [Janibacter hoylei]|uniref:hypothetical protein n=1 Tax=Janibacter hoylei TaxID=364298 RepID=UPI0012EAE817|nr:hypothetical protein [Janibacter hoylei]